MPKVHILACTNLTSQGDDMSLISSGMAVAYYRVSTQKQGIDGLGMEAQKRAVEQFTQHHGMQLIAAYSEVESGRKNNRPVLLQAIEHCKQTGATLLIARLDRLSRNAAFINNLMESEIKFVACDMPSANTFTLQVLAAFAQQEAELIRLRVHKALQTKKERNQKLGSPFDFTDEHRRKATETIKAKAMNKPEYKRAETLVKSLLTQGYKLNDIAKELSAGCFVTPGGKLQWTATGVRRIAVRAGILKEKKKISANCG